MSSHFEDGITNSTLNCDQSPKRSLATHLGESFKGHNFQGNVKLVVQTF